MSKIFSFGPDKVELAPEAALSPTQVAQQIALDSAEDAIMKEYMSAMEDYMLELEAYESASPRSRPAQEPTRPTPPVIPTPSVAVVPSGESIPPGSKGPKSATPSETLVNMI